MIGTILGVISIIWLCAKSEGCREIARGYKDGRGK